MQQHQQFLHADGVVAVLAASDCLPSAIHNAASLGNSELLEVLLQQLRRDCATAAAADPSALTAAFVSAAAKGHWRFLQLLLDPPAIASPALAQRLLAATGPDGMSALMSAAARDQGMCMQVLLAHSPLSQVAATAAIAQERLRDCNLPGPGSNALLFAAHAGRLRPLQLLLEHNPQAQLEAARATCPRHDPFIVCCMAARMATATCLHTQLATIARYLDCATLLLTHYPDATEQQPREKFWFYPNNIDTALSWMVFSMQYWPALGAVGVLAPDYPVQLALTQFFDTCLSKGALLDWYSNELDVLFRTIIRGMASRALVPGSPGEAAAAANAACQQQDRAASAEPRKPVHASRFGCLCHDLHARYRKWSKLGLACFPVDSLPLDDDTGCYGVPQQADERGSKAPWAPLPDAGKEAAGARPCAVTCAADRACRAALALLASPCPSDRELDRALLVLCTGVSQLDPAADHARILSSHECAARLVARGAFFGVQQLDKQPVAVLRSILKDMACKALANEAARDLSKHQL